MVAQGLINTNAFSLWVDDHTAGTASILFGGVNTARFKPPLSTLPLISNNGVFEYIQVQITAIGVNKTSAQISNMTATLDPGNSLIYMPESYANAIWNAVGAKYDQRMDLAMVDCSLQNSSGTLDITFGTPTLHAPLSDLVFRIGTSAGRPICSLGVLPTNATYITLGAIFLASTYVVYDLTRNELSVAQTKFDSSKPDAILALNSAGVPGLAKTSEVAQPDNSASPSSTTSSSSTSSSRAAGTIATAAPDFVSYQMALAIMGAIAVAVF